MATNNHNEDGLVYRDNISLTWKNIDFEPDANHLALVNESNEIFLRSVAAIGELPQEAAQEDTSALGQELARIDLKLNLLLDLVGQLVYQQSPIPAATTPVTLTAHSISWEADNLPALGSTVFMQIYVQRGTPKPLSFYGKVVGDENSRRAGRASAQFVGLSDSVVSGLDKLIFRHHRRAVAFKRSGKESPT